MSGIQGFTVYKKGPTREFVFQSRNREGLYMWLQEHNEYDPPLYVIYDRGAGHDVSPERFMKEFEVANQIGNDAVNHPAHYNQYEGIEIIDLVEQMPFNPGNVIKYVARAGFKSPETHIQDLEKARFYLDREINRIKARQAKEAQ